MIISTQRHHRSILFIFLPQERRNVKIIQASTNSAQNPYLLSDQEEKITIKKHQENKQRLRVPRRPPWTKAMTTAQLERQEKDAFLEWRRGLAECVVLFHILYIVPDVSKTAVSRIARISYSHPLNAISKSGGNYGVSWNAHILSCKLSTLGTR